MTDSQTAGWAVPRIWGDVPARNMNFTGREEILTQLRQSTAGNVTAVLPGAPLPRALQGLGGVGKTAVAIEFAHRYQSEYELIWWIQADQLPLVRSSLAALAAPLGLEPAGATGIETAAKAVLDALRRGVPVSRWLLIFDNADQPQDLKDIIPSTPGHGHVLITSRNNRWQSVIETVQVDVFTRAESKEFLTKRTHEGLTEPDADRLAESLGDLPLALDQAGAMLAETGMPVEQYLLELDEHVTRIMSEGRSTGYPKSVTAAWMLSVDTVQEHLPEAKELLRCCAFFGQDPIPRDVFRGTPATRTRIGELIADPILLARAIGELARFALVKVEGRTLSVHRLIQALLRDELSPDEQTKYQHEVHLILAAGAPTEPTNTSVWPKYRELLAHVASPATQLARCPVPAVRKFALDVVRYLYLSSDPRSCLSLADRFIDQWTKDSGQDNEFVLDARRHRGNALRQLGRYSEAYEVIEETLNRTKDVLGDQDPLTLTLRNSFGADLRARGNFAEARKFDEETLALHTEAFGSESPQTLRVMNNVASDYARTSRYHEARELHQKVYLLQSKASSGVSATEILSSLNGLAWAVRLCGDFAEARDLGGDAWNYGRAALGSDHLETLRTANALSIALRRLGTDYKSALQTANEVWEQSKRLLGDGHPDTMAAAINLTNIQRTMGNTDDALKLAEATVARYPQVYGPEHPYNYGCMGNLALLRRVTGDVTAARQLNETARDGLDKRLGRNHHYSLTVTTNLASDLAALGDVAGARALGEDTLAKLRDLLGPDDPMTLGCAANLVLDLRAAGAENEAKRLEADTKKRYTDRLRAEHPDVKAFTAGQRLDFDFDPLPI